MPGAWLGMIDANNPFAVHAKELSWILNFSSKYFLISPIFFSIPTIQKEQTY